MPLQCFMKRGGLVHLFVRRIAAHLADGVAKHGVLLVEVVDRFLVLGVVVHRTLQEEAEEALYAVTAGTHSKVTQKHEIET